MEVEIAYSTLKLVFAEAGPAPTLELGPIDDVRIDGEALRSTRGGEVLAWPPQAYLARAAAPLLPAGLSKPGAASLGERVRRVRARGEIGERALI